MSHPIITRLLINGNLEEAIKALEVAAKDADRSDLERELIAQAARISRLKARYRKNLLTEQEYGLEMGKIDEAILFYPEELNIPADLAWNGEAWVEGPLEVPASVDGPVEEPGQSGRPTASEAHSPTTNHPADATNPAQKGPKTILYLAASPKGEARIQGDVEFREMDEALRKGRVREGFELLRPEFAITGQGLIDALSQEPNVVHFSAHGEEEKLIFTDEKNEAVEIPFTALLSQFEQLKGITELVVFNSCYSADMAKELSKLGMYVSGNNLEILDEASINFVKGLYTGLGNGKSYERAFNDALTLVTIMNPNEVHIMEIWKDGEKLDI